MKTKEQKRKKRQEDKEARAAAGVKSPVFSCPICGVSYSRIQRLTAHLGKHTSSIDFSDQSLDDPVFKRARIHDEQDTNFNPACRCCIISFLSESMIPCACAKGAEDAEFERWREEKLQSIRDARAKLEQLQE